MTEAIFTSRREFLAGTAVALTSATIPLSALSSSNTTRLAGRPALVVYQAHDACATAFADELAQAGFATLALSDDLVRQWRDGLGRLVLEENFVLVGFTNWSDYFLLRGLCAEHRRFPAVELQRSCDGSPMSAGKHARDLVEAAQSHAQFAEIAKVLSARVAHTRPGKFSWVI